MSLFNKDAFNYKGYSIYKDPENGKWIIRKGGRYGVNVDQADSKDQAKRIVDNLT
jgi:topoisomerase IA-like protein